MRPERAALLAAGAGAGLLLLSLHRIAVAVYWPREATVLSAALLCGGAAGAASFFLFLERKRPAEGRAGPWALALFPLWGLGALVTLVGARATTGELALITAGGGGLIAAAVLAGGEGENSARAGYFWVGLGAALGADSAAAFVFAGPVPHPVATSLFGIALSALAALFSAALRGRYGAAFLAGALLAVSAALFTHGQPWLSVGGRGAVSGGMQKESREFWSGGDRIEATGSQAKGVISLNRGMRNISYGNGQPFRPDVPLRKPHDGRLDVLVLGYPGGDMLSSLLRRRVWHRNMEATLVEGNRALHRTLVGAWPLLDAAVSNGGLNVELGNPRRFLKRERGAYDFIIIDSGPSERGHREGALAFREDYLATVEGYRDILRILEPDGLLLVRGPGTGRTVMTVRDAIGEAGEVALLSRFVVVGESRKPVSKCYYRPEGFSAGDISWMHRAVSKRGGEAFYHPGFRKYRYYELLANDHPRGLAFTTPQDLSPPRDKRPFFHHLERLRISPSAPALPEERGNYGPWALQFIPPGDGLLWRAVLAALILVAPVLLCPLGVYAHRTGLAGHARELLWPLFLAGVSVAAVYRGVGTLAFRYDPSGGASWVGGAFFMVAGAAWLYASRSMETRRSGGRVLACVTLAAGTAGGRLADVLAMHPAALLWAVLFAGGAAGAMAGGMLSAARAVLPRAAGLGAAAFLLGAAFAWPLASLVAVSFGFPTLWLTAAAAAAGALYATRTL